MTHTATEPASKPLALAYRHHCSQRDATGLPSQHTSGNGRPRRVGCAYCGGRLITEPGYWTVQEWRSDGRYSLACAVKIAWRESMADDWRLDHRLGANPELVVRWIATAEPLTVSGARCAFCASRVLHRLDECARYAVAEPEQVISEPPASAEPAGQATVQRPADASEDAAGQYSDHHTARGTWCRWSMCHVSARLAARADQHCPADCPDSSIELFAPAERLEDLGLIHPQWGGA